MSMVSIDHVSTGVLGSRRMNLKMLIADGRREKKGPLNLVGLAAVGETGRIREA